MRPSKRDELVSKALDVFYSSGFQATGLDKIVSETGISKTAIYNHFRTKEDLILAALRLRDERFRNWLFRRMEELADTPKGQLIALFDALGEWFNSDEFQGCIFVKVASEYQDHTDPIFRQATEHKRLIKDHLLALAEACELQNAQNIVCQLLVLKEGAIIAAYLQMVDDPVKHARDAALALIPST